MTPPTPSPSLLGVPRPCPASSPPTETIGPPPERTTPSSQPTPDIPTRPPKDPVGGGDEPESGHQDNDAQPPAARIHQLRIALSASTNRLHELARTVPLNCGRRSRGPTWSAIHVQAFCKCAWATSWQPWATNPAAAAAAIHMIDAALEDHSRQSGHRPFPHDGTPEVDGYHQRCGWFHGFQHACPIPPDAPAGQMTRICGLPTLGDPMRSLDRLAAIQQLRTWLDDQQLQAIIGAPTRRLRLARHRPSGRRHHPRRLRQMGRPHRAVRSGRTPHPRRQPAHAEQRGPPATRSNA
jgi:hypothetical protein